MGAQNREEQELQTAYEKMSTSSSDLVSGSLIEDPEAFTNESDDESPTDNTDTTEEGSTSSLGGFPAMGAFSYDGDDTVKTTTNSGRVIDKKVSLSSVNALGSPSRTPKPPKPTNAATRLPSSMKQESLSQSSSLGASTRSTLGSYRTNIKAGTSTKRKSALEVNADTNDLADAVVTEGCLWDAVAEVSPSSSSDADLSVRFLNSVNSLERKVLSFGPKGEVELRNYLAGVPTAVLVGSHSSKPYEYTSITPEPSRSPPLILESIAAKCSFKSDIVFAQKKLGGLFPSAIKDNDADKNVSFLWLLEAKLPSGKRIACSLALPDTNVGKQGAPKLVLWEGLSS
jgi:hypothetical protein